MSNIRECRDSSDVAREAYLARLAAHESVVDDWTEYDESRPDGVRERLWRDPFFDPGIASESERRFMQTRRHRQRVLRWTGDMP